MEKMIIDGSNAVMDNQHNPLRHLGQASEHYFMPVQDWTWSMISSLTPQSIFELGKED